MFSRKHLTSVVNRHRIDANPDPTFHLDAEPDTDPDPTQSFTHVERSEEFFYFSFLQCQLTLFYLSHSIS